MRKNKSIDPIGWNCINLNYSQEIRRYDLGPKKYYCKLTSKKCEPSKSCNQYDDKGNLLFSVKEMIDENQSKN
jgi:hypothetical protein